MCGIIGIISTSDVADDILQTLQRLEYRGYDSAGIATIHQGKLHKLRAAGKLVSLTKKLALDPLPGPIGIGHTRWATHGAPTETNAHPHTSGPVTLVHNGIIENYQELKRELTSPEINLLSETDTEVAAALIHQKWIELGDPAAAFHAALKMFRGAFALGAMFEGEPDLLLAARLGSPLVVAQTSEGNYLGSDAIALGPFSSSITYLEEGDWAVLRRTETTFFDTQGQEVTREATKVDAAFSFIDKGNHPHFMLKEIYEQPEVLSHTLSPFLSYSTNQINEEVAGPVDWQNLSHLNITACGTAFYSAMVARYWFEKMATLPVIHDVASEFRYRDIPLSDQGLTVVISQSGETADTLASMSHSQAMGQKTLALVNVTTSTIARQADHVVKTSAGAEIGVASSKAFTCQLASMACLALSAAKARGRLDAKQEAEAVSTLSSLSRQVNDVLALESDFARLAEKIHRASSVMFLGRGLGFPIAQEGALKLKELSYIHAEAYPAGELKHGPIALIDQDLPSVVIAPSDAHFEKVISNVQEVKARGGPIYLITDARGADHARAMVDDLVVMPTGDDLVWPILYSVPMQLLAYHAAKMLGTDIDQPRNLAKSVTVE